MALLESQIESLTSDLSTHQTELESKNTAVEQLISSKSQLLEDIAVAKSTSEQHKDAYGAAEKRLAEQEQEVRDSAIT